MHDSPIASACVAGIGTRFLSFAYAPAACGRAEPAIAAARAGFIGVANAELGQTDGLVLSLVHAMADPLRGAKASFGLKLASLSPRLLERLAPFAAQGLRWLIVEATGLDSLFSGEPVSLPPLAIVAETCGRNAPGWLGRVDAIVVKGNESGGFVGEESAFILFQHWVKRSRVPVIVRGGMSPQVAAACHAMGAAGGVFDSQLLLFEDYGLPQPLRALLGSLSGSETVAAGDPAGGSYFRLLQHPRCTAAKAFLVEQLLSPAPELRRAVERASCGWDDPGAQLIPLGHEIALAASYRETYRTIRGLFQAVEEAVATQPARAAAAPSLVRGGPLAASLGIEYPIVQGPMTRVSDNAAFAAAVAREGALPMVAIATMRPGQIHPLLEETREKVEGRPWGVGLLGFLPKATLDGQIEAVLGHHPDFAIIAGGRPDQAVALEARGVPTFLHLPSARLLGYYLENGSRRFIFEGRECGGHVGPLSSFVLWSSMIDRLVAGIDAGAVAGSELECVFAGGVHDELSSALLQVLTAPLAERGVRVGVLVGTAYVLTREIVESGALLPNFQATVLSGAETGLLTTGPGHASRCMRTPFVDEFLGAQRALAADASVPEDEKRERLDNMILGTLRLASKGIRRAPGTGELETVPDTEQYASGMFMIGQVASLRDDLRTIAELHRSLTGDAAARLQAAATARARPEQAEAGQPLDIAIIGVSAALPGALDKDAFWANVLGKVDSVDEIPRHRWDWRLYFDGDRRAKDKIYSKWGGFLEDMPFEPGRYGITPASMKTIDPMQLMALKLADEALADAGYAEIDARLRERTAVVIGASGGAGDVAVQYSVRSETPRFRGDLDPELAESLPKWSEDTFAGILINVISGRISNRLDLGGPNFTTDAACASSLAALYQAAHELRQGRSDMAIAGGVDTQQSPFGFMCFAQTQALSPTGRCRSFDQSADGIAISEGMVMLVLKRLEDAEAAGDRIYAVLKGIGSSSDGKGKALSAPEPAGQLRAMRRAYEQAGYSPASVQLFEAHGTGTVVGDTAELESTGRLVTADGVAPRRAAIGSVKTNIGHTKATAGLAGALKVTLALHHRVLPPHRGVEAPNKVLGRDDAPLYLLDEAEPWLAPGGDPRRASVSAFGFGGTNFHATLEEYAGEYRADRLRRPTAIWPAELLLLSAADRAGLLAAAAEVREIVAANPRLAARDLAASYAELFDAAAGARASAVFTSLAELDGLLGALAGAIEGNARLPEAVCFAEGPADGALAALFPGQGSQYVFMGREAAVCFDEVAGRIDAAHRLLRDRFAARHASDVSLGHFLFPRGAYDEAARRAAQLALTATDVAQPALGAVEAGYWSLLAEGFGLKADMFAGHSYGEFAAHHAAGVLGFADLITLSEARGRLIVDQAAAAGSELGTMLALATGRTEAEALVGGIDGLVLANHNAPAQVIVSGSHDAVARAAAVCAANGIEATPLPVAAAFHSGLMAPAKEALATVIATLDWNVEAADAVYSNERARPHGADVQAAMAEHLVRPVNFVDEIEAMYADGARVFLEVGPRTVLTRLVGRILGDRPHEVIATDGLGGGLKGLLGAIGRLSVAGRPMRLARLFEGRDCAAARATPAELRTLDRHPGPSKRGWWINGSGVRRADEPVRQIGVTLEDFQARRAQQAEPAAPEPAARPAASPASVSAFSLAPVRGDGIGARRSLMFDKPPIPDFEPGSSISVEFFRLVASALESARNVALAELGGMPPQLGDRGAVGSGAAQRRVRLRPAAQPLATSGTHFAPARAQAAPASASPAPAPQAASAVAQAPAPAPAAAEAPKAAGAKPPGETELRAVLLRTVAEKTGYDEDMLDFDQKLEADLGIDSIKRVDVVAELMKVLPSGFANALGNEGRSRLAQSKTLAEMLGVLAGATEGAANFDSAGAGSAPVAVSREAGHDLPRPDQSRFVVEPVREDLRDDILSELTGGRFLLTPCAGGLAETILGRLEAAGREAELLPQVALADEAALTGWIAANRKRLGRLAGVVHLGAVDAPACALDGEVSAWREQLFRNEKALFLLLRDLDFADAAHAVAVTALGGLFGRDGGPAAPPMLQGGAVGLLKSLSREREDRRCRAIDIDPAVSAADQADAILREMAASGGRIEIGYPVGKRVIFRTTLMPLAGATDAPEVPLVVLATGGARGITAEAVQSLAARGSVFILTGRTPEPGAADLLRDSPALAALTGVPELARHFAKSLGLPLAEARQKAGRVIAAREMADNLAAMRGAGATVEYVVMDVTDEVSVAATLSSIYATHGRIDGVVHGAGIIEDRLLADTPGDSWDRVVETKVLGLLLLLKHLRRERLKFLHVFSSVAGRYGNAGQTSYATANELMNRLCCRIGPAFGSGTHVRAMNWGPWGPTTHGTGMVTPETEQKFRAQGVRLVDARLGRDLFLAETLAGTPGGVEVVYGLAPWEKSEAARSEFVPAGAGGLLGNATARPGPDMKLRLPFTIRRDEPYLQDHRIDGRPVLPMAIALEAMAEAVRRSYGDGWRVIAIEDARLFKGVLVEQPGRELVVVMAQTSHGMGETQSVAAKLYTADEERVPHYGASFVLAPATNAAPAAAPLVPAAEAFPIDAATAYGRHLFHGPVFHAILNADAVWQDGAIVSVRASNPAELLRSPGEGAWIFDPLVIDGVAQLPLLWASALHDRFALPMSFTRIERHAEDLAGADRIEFRVTDRTADSIVADARVLDRDGTVILTVSGMRHVMRAQTGTETGAGRTLKGMAAE